MPGFVAFINKEIKPQFFFSSLAVSGLLKLIIYQQFKAWVHLPVHVCVCRQVFSLCQRELVLLECNFHFVKATISLAHKVVAVFQQCLSFKHKLTDIYWLGQIRFIICINRQIMQNYIFVEFKLDFWKIFVSVKTRQRHQALPSSVKKYSLFRETKAL